MSDNTGSGDGVPWDESVPITPVPEPMPNVPPVPTPPPDPTPSPDPAPDRFGRFHAILAAAERGAALVYHGVLAIERDFAKLSNNPEVELLVHVGLRYAAELLARAGIPIAETMLVAEDILAAIQAQGVQDASVLVEPTSDTAKREVKRSARKAETSRNRAVKSPRKDKKPVAIRKAGRR